MRNLSCHITITWIRTLLSFEIIFKVGTHMCKRLQDTFSQEDLIDDCCLNVSQGCAPKF